MLQLPRHSSRLHRSKSLFRFLKTESGHALPYRRQQSSLRLFPPKIPAKNLADDHFKDVIVPKFDAMKNHYRGQVNGKWSASGTDENGRKWFAWANNSWIFVMSGSDKGNLMKAIDAFKYVAL